MIQNPLIKVLETHRLIRLAQSATPKEPPDEVARFEQTLEKLAQSSDFADLSNLHLI